MNKISFDISALQKFSMDEVEIKEFIEEFIQQSLEDVEGLKKLHYSKDQDTIRQLIHRMKNITLLLNIQPVLRYIQQLESMNDTDPIFYNLVYSLTEGLNAVITELRKSVLDNIG